MIKSPIFSTGVGLVQKGFEEVIWKEVKEKPGEEELTDGEPPTVGIGGKLKIMLENFFSDDIN